MLSKFFLERPVFAWVIAISHGVGVIAIYNLPVCQYPEMAPPSISHFLILPLNVSPNRGKQRYAIIEHKMTGLDNLITFVLERFGRRPLGIDLRPATDVILPGPKSK
jgi:multidrug efflux pump subunit AcrB